MIPKTWHYVVLALALIAVAIALTISSDSSTPPGPSAHQTSYLCQEVRNVTSLTVTREAPGHQFTFSFPSVVKVKSLTLSQGVAAAACELPKEPKTVHSCPAAFNVSYQLTFAIAGEKGMGGESLTINPTGCQEVTGLGAIRTSSLAPQFYSQLATALGLNPTKVSAQSLFAGTFS